MASKQLGIYRSGAFRNRCARLKKLGTFANEFSKGFSDVLPRAKPVKQPKGGNENYLNLFPVFDAHFGMLAWHEETGQDYDLEIAEELFTRWFVRAIASSPDAHTALLLLGGDLFHWDGLEAVTPEHKNILDADTRFQKVVRVVIRSMRNIVRMLLESHQHVHIVVLEGNHDLSSSVHLREWMAAHYENEPRVTVDTSPSVYQCYVWGDVSLFFHHGHKRKVGNIAEVFTGRFRKEWGSTEFSYGHVGHLHSQEQRETSLMVVEQHRTLAAKDAYASRGGWAGGRSASVITYHSKYGEAFRAVITPAMCE